MPDPWRILLTLLFIFPFSSAQETHSHGAPEKLGKVSFPISCTPAVQEQFDRGVALLHSFQVIQQLKNMPKLNTGDFKIAYASTAMPVRCVVERGRWAEAAGVVSPTGAPPHVVAIAVWARGLGLARSGRAAQARTEIDRLWQIEEQLRTSGNDYWATHVGILTREVMQSRSFR